MPATLHDDASASEPDGRVKNNLLQVLFNRKKEDADAKNVATEQSEKELIAHQSEKSAAAPPRDKKVNPLAGPNLGKYCGLLIFLFYDGCLKGCAPTNFLYRYSQTSANTSATATATSR
jgi:hypothetical protein